MHVRVAHTQTYILFHPKHASTCISASQLLTVLTWRGLGLARKAKTAGQLAQAELEKSVNLLRSEDKRGETQPFYLFYLSSLKKTFYLSF